MEEEAQEQQNNMSRVPPHLRKYAFKKGVSGNPGGRPEGSISMKNFAKRYLESMPEEDRIEFMNGLDPKTIWEMAEGKPKQDTDITTNGESIGPVLVKFIDDKPKND